MDHENIHAFSRVDQVSNPQTLVRFLETAAARYFGDINARSFSLLRARPGTHLLDVGCGTGNDACTLSRLAGSGGRVVGLDSSQAMITEAHRRAAEAGLAAEFYLGDAQHLTFDDGSFDGVRSSRLLCHVADPRLALTEMIRVVRPGGRMVCLEPDHETLIIASPGRDCTRKILNHFCDDFLHGWTGRWLPVWFREFGLQNIEVQPHTIQMDYDFLMGGLQIEGTVQRVQQAGLITAQDAAAWLSYQQQAAEAGLFYSAITFFLVSGEKK